jgi:hypothetical protein
MRERIAGMRLHVSFGVFHEPIGGHEFRHRELRLRAYRDSENQHGKMPHDLSVYW